MSTCRMLLIEFNEKLNSDDFQSLTFLAKDIVNRKRIKEKENRLEFFDDLEKKAVIKCGPEETDLLFFKQAFLIMGRNDLVSALDKVGGGPCKQSSGETFVTKRRWVAKLRVYFYFILFLDEGKPHPFPISLCLFITMTGSVAWYQRHKYVIYVSAWYINILNKNKKQKNNKKKTKKPTKLLKKNKMSFQEVGISLYVNYGVFLVSNIH